MKKIAALCLSFGMLFSLGACSQNKVSEEALDQLQTGIQNIVDMKSAEYSFSFSTPEDEENEASTMTLHGAYIWDSAVPEFSASMDLQQGEETAEGYMQMYVHDGYYYMNVMDFMKQKMELYDAKEAGMVPEAPIEKEDLEISKDELKEYLTEASVKGNTLTLVFDSEKINEILQNELEDSQEEESDDMISTLMGEVSITELTMEITLTDDFITKASIHVTAAAANVENSGSSTMDIIITFDNINEVKEIDFPDFSDYEEIDMSEYEDYADIEG